MLSRGSFFGAGGKTPTRTSKAGGRGEKAKRNLEYNCKQQVLHEKAKQVTKNQSTHEIL